MKHLDEVNETYWEHFRCAIYFSGVMLKLSIICAVHSLIPCVFETTASERLDKLLSEMQRCNDEA